VAATYRLAQAARLLGVSDDTVRRWVDAGRLAAHRTDGGPLTVRGTDLAAFAVEQAASLDLDAEHPAATSARNRLVGLVTTVTTDTVMAQVELQAGPFRIVSLLSAEAVRELGLEPGVLATAVVKSTNVVIEVPHRGA
jgi:molybdopterin-binding protein